MTPLVVANSQAWGIPCAVPTGMSSEPADRRGTTLVLVAGFAPSHPPVFNEIKNNTTLLVLGCEHCAAAGLFPVRLSGVTLISLPHHITFCWLTSFRNEMFHNDTSCNQNSGQF